MAVSLRSIQIKPLYRSLGFALAAGLLVSSCTASIDSSNSDTAPETAQQVEGSVQSPAPEVSPSSAAEGEADADLAIVPGERVGSVTTRTTYDDLVGLYGEDALEDVEVSMGEGTFSPGTRVNQGDRSFSVVWLDETRTSIQSIQEFGPAWQVGPGVGIGTSFEDLQTKLGTFELYGFGWDYGGTLLLDGTELEPYEGALVLRVSPGVDPTSVAESYESVMGEQLYLSNTPALQDLDLSVSEMIVTLE